MTCDHQCEPQDTDSSWEDIESEQEDEQKLYPTNQPTKPFDLKHEFRKCSEVLMGGRPHQGYDQL